MSPTIVIVIAISPPPPTPCRPRARIRWVMPPARPESTEPARKMPIAIWNIVRRPYRSLSFP